MAKTIEPVLNLTISARDCKFKKVRKCNSAFRLQRDKWWSFEKPKIWNFLVSKY